MRSLVLGKGKLFYGRILIISLFLLLTMTIMSGITQGAQITASDPDDGETDVPIDKWIIIRFNRSIEEKTLDENLKISPKLTYGWRTSWSNDHKELLIKPNSALAYDEEYTITLIGVEDVDGKSIEPSTITFKTESAPTIKEIVWGLFENLWAGFVSIVPNILLLILLLIIGYLLAKGASWVFAKALKRLGFDEAMEKVGVGRQLRSVGIKSSSKFLGIFVFWFIFVIVLQIAISVMGVPTISDILGPIILFIPRILLAIILILIGLYVANIVAQKFMDNLAKTEIGKQLQDIDEKTKTSGFSMIRIVAIFLKVFILLFFVQIALEIVNIGLLSDFITPVLIILPLVLVALFIVLIGLLVTEVFRKIILRVVQEFEINKLIAPVEETIGRKGVVLRLFILVVKVLIMLIFIQLAIGVLNSTGAFNQLAQLINMIIIWIPNIIAALIIILVGFWFAGWVSSRVLTYGKEVEVPFPETMAVAVKFLIIYIAGVMAIAQIGFQVQMLYIVTAIIIGGVFIGVGAGFAIGSKDIFANLGGYFQNNKILKVGSKIKVEDKYTGTVENIGHYSTTIVTDKGERIIIPNSQLIKSIVIEVSPPPPPSRPATPPPAPSPSSSPPPSPPAPPAVPPAKAPPATSASSTPSQTS